MKTALITRDAAQDRSYLTELLFSKKSCPSFPDKKNLFRQMLGKK